MSRTVTGNILNADGTVPDEDLEFNLLDLIITDDGTIVLPGAYNASLTAVTGAFSITLPTPGTGTARYAWTYPSGHQRENNIATGPAVDLSTLETTATTSADPDDLQTLMDAAERFEDTTVTSWPYTLLDTDRYIRASGTGNLTLLAAAQSKVPRIVFNYGTGVITVLPSGSDTINGAASKAIYPGEAWVFIDNSAGIWDAW